MKYTDIFDHRTKKSIGYEKRDDKDRVISLSCYIDDTHEEKVENEYTDLENGEWYQSKVTKYWIGEPMCKGRSDVERKFTTNYTYLFNTEIPTSIIIEEWNDGICDLYIKEKYEFDIQSINEENRLALVTCTDRETEKHIIFTIDTLNNTVVKMTDEVNEIYTTTEKYCVGDRLENRYEMNIDESRCGSGENEEYIKTITCIHDNGLYERCFEYDINDNLIGGYIRSYYAGGLISYEYIIDEKCNIVDHRYYLYNDGRLKYIHDGCGNILFEYFEEDGSVPKEYPTAHLEFSLDTEDRFKI